MIKFKNVPGVEQINLYEFYKNVIKKEEQGPERLALLFTAPWSLSASTWAQMMGCLKNELNTLEKCNFIEVFIVPSDENEDDEKSYVELAQKANG